MKPAFVVLSSILLCFPLIVNGIETAPTASLLITPQQAQVQVGQAVTIQIEVRKAKDLFGAPFHILYDPHLLEVMEVSEGDFLKKDGAKTVFLHKVDEERGRIIVGLSRLGNATGVSGDGTLVSVTFKAMQAGQAVFSFEKVDFRNSRQGSLPIHPQTARIEVR